MQNEQYRIYKDEIMKSLRSFRIIFMLWVLFSIVGGIVWAIILTILPYSPFFDDIPYSVMQELQNIYLIILVSFITTSFFIIYLFGSYRWNSAQNSYRLNRLETLKSLGYKKETENMTIEQIEARIEVLSETVEKT